MRKFFLWLLTSCFLIFTVSTAQSTPQNFLDKGVREYQNENYEEALESFKQAEHLSADSTLLSYYLGITYKQTGNYQEATRYLRKALELSPPATQAYPELVEVLFNLNDLTQAKEWIVRAEKAGAYPGLMAFQKGLILQKEGKDSAAIEAFTRAKELDHALRQNADFQIALSLSKERKFSQAREILKAVILIDPTTETSSYAREYEQSLAKSLAKYKTWGGSFGLGYQYDTNVILKPDSGIPGSTITGEEDSSILATFRAYYNPLLEGPWLFNAQYGLYTNNYFKTKTHSLINQSLSVNPGYTLPWGAVTLPLSYSYAWLEGVPYTGVLLAKPTLNIITTRGQIAQLSAGYAKRDVFPAPLIPDEDRDGNLFLGSLAYIVPFGDRGIINLFYEYSRDATTGQNWDNSGNRFSLNLLIPLAKRFSLNLSAEYFQQDYTNTHTIFGVKRLDKMYSGIAGLIWELRKDLKLYLQYYGAKVESNIPIYSYKRNVFTLGTEYLF